MKFIPMLLALLIPVSASALSEKFFRKADEKVWSMDLPQFNAKMAIPDSISNGASAVIIATYSDVDYDKEVQPSALKPSGMTNRTTRKKLERTMIKLLDQSAVEKYSDFEFADSENFDLNGLIPMGAVDIAWGARVTKPDGTVVNVDVKDAYVSGDGKKGKDNKTYKIAIPNLEPGDVIDYYNYSESWLEETNFPPEKLEIAARYPIILRTYKGSFNPELTVEYRNYNDAPMIYKDADAKGKNVYTLQIYGIPAVKIGAFTSASRQVPFIKLAVLNNTAVTYRPRSSRPGGFYANIPAATYYRDVAHTLKTLKIDSPIVGHAAKYANDYFKTHPDLTDEQKAEVAWVALWYAGAIDKYNSINELSGAKMMAQLLKKLKVSAPETIGIGITAQRNNTPVNQIMSWREPDYVTVYGDMVFTPNTIDAYMPGETGGLYQGETVIVYPSDEDIIDPDRAPKSMTMKSLRYTGNSSVITSEATLSDDGDDKVNVNVHAVINGAQKDGFADLNSGDEWIMAAEDFLEIPADKRFKSKKRDTEGRAKEIEESMKGWAKRLLGTKPESIDNIKVNSRGIMPGQKAIDFSLDAVVDGLVTRAGNDLMVNVGALFGDNTHLEGDDRTRTFDAFLLYPTQDTYKLILHLPEGYTVTPEALAALDSQVSNRFGLFFSQARLEGDTVVIQTKSQAKTNVVPVANWPEFLEVMDALAIFNNSTLVLTRK